MEITVKRKHKLYIDSVNQKLICLGFAHDPLVFGHDDVFLWHKPAFDGTNYFIRIIAASSMDYDNAFSCTVGITSTYMTNAVNQLRDLESVESHQSMWPVEEGPMQIMQVALHWILLDNVDALDKTVWPAMAASADENAQELVDDIQQYGLPLLQKADSEVKLIDFLLDIDNYPHAEGLVKGPESMDSDVYAAFYLMKLNKSEAAISALNQAYNIGKAEIHQDWEDDEDFDDILKEHEQTFAQYRQVIK
jgi:hypothetical protein